MRLLKLFKMRNLLFTLCILISLAASSFAQIDNGTNYISDSKTKKIATKSQCDVIFTKKGDIIIALVKDTFAEIVKYKTCKDYITNATVSGAIVTLPTYEIDKIVFSNQLTKYYRVKRPITRSRNEIFKGENINPNESLKRNFLFPFMKQKSPPTSIFKNSKLKSNTKLDKSNFVFVSGGFGNQEIIPLFTEIGYLKQKNKRFGIGSSFSFISKPSDFGYNGNYEYVGLYYGPYTINGVYVGNAGYDDDGNYNGTGPYDNLGNYIGYSGGYDEVYGMIKPTINYFSILVDFKFNFLTKKRIQPFIITSLGGSYRSVGYNSTSKYYSDGFVSNSRISTGLDFISKNNKWVFSSFISWTDQPYIDQIIAFKLSFGF